MEENEKLKLDEKYMRAPINRRKKHMRLMKHRSDALLFMKERS